MKFQHIVSETMFTLFASQKHYLYSGNLQKSSTQESSLSAKIILILFLDSYFHMFLQTLLIYKIKYLTCEQLMLESNLEF